MASKYKQAVRDFIDRFWKTHFYSPSIREIAEHLETLPESGNSVSTSHVDYVLEHDLGYKKKSPNEKGLARQIIPEWVKEAIKEANIEHND